MLIVTQSATNQRWRTFGAYAVAWTVAGIFFFSQDLARIVLWHQHTPIWDDLLSRMVGSYISAALTPVVFWLGRRWAIERPRWAQRTALHLALSSTFALIELALETVAYLQMAILPDQIKGPFWQAYTVMLVVGFHGNVIVYWTLLGIESGMSYYKRFREREKESLGLKLDASELKTQLIRAQLSALKMQLQPHFLFNTLNAIVVLVRQGRTSQAEETLTRFSDLLRCVLEDVEAQEVPLRRELECLQLYLAIEQVRFQGRLSVEVSTESDTLDAAVPHMSLQPIVENAVRHGIGRRSEAGLIRLSASRVGDLLRIQISDNGPGLQPPRRADDAGIGLANTRARLVQLYGNSAKLVIGNGEPYGVVVTIELPYRSLPPIGVTQRMELHDT